MRRQACVITASLWLSLSTSAQLLPDLRVDRVVAPGRLVPGKLENISTFVTNASTVWTDATVGGVYLSSDAAITTSDRLLVRFWPQPAGPGSRWAFHNSFRLPRDVPTGRFWIGSIIDFRNTVIESDETNNKGATLVDCAGLPDLVVVDFAPARTTWHEGASVAVSTRLRNDGGAPAPVARHGIYFSRDRAITTLDTLLATRASPPIQPGNTWDWNAAVRIPQHGVVAPCWLGVLADHDGSVTEVSEANNAAAVRGSCSKSAVAAADLTVTAFSASTRSIQDGADLTLDATITNRGNKDSGPFAFGFYFSADNVITALDRSHGGIRHPGLAKNTSVRVTQRRAVKFLPVGPVWIGAFADAFQEVAESDETNNRRLLRGAITPGGDLQATPPVAPGQLVAGTEYSIKVTIRNPALGFAEGARGALVLSNDATITRADGVLTTFMTDRIWPGKSETRTVRCRVPFHARAGRAWLGSIADPFDEITETDETNNASGTAVTVAAYTGAARVLEIVPDGVAGPASNQWAARVTSAGGGRVALAITAPSRADHWYWCMWTSRRGAFQADAWTAFANLIGPPVFTRWIGRLDASGRTAAGTRPVLALPKSLPVIAPATLFVHAFFFDPRTLVPAGKSDGAAIVRLNR